MPENNNLVLYSYRSIDGTVFVYPDTMQTVFVHNSKWENHINKLAVEGYVPYFDPFLTRTGFWFRENSSGVLTDSGDNNFSEEHNATDTQEAQRPA